MKKTELFEKMHEFFSGVLPDRVTFFATRGNPGTLTLLQRALGVSGKANVWKRIVLEWDAFAKVADEPEVVEKLVVKEEAKPVAVKPVTKGK
jgi:hypothetical protein